MTRILMALTAKQSEGKTTNQLKNLFLDMYDAQGIDTSKMRISYEETDPKELLHNSQEAEMKLRELDPEKFNYEHK